MSLNAAPYARFNSREFILLFKPMKLVVCDPDNIPPWIYPDVMSEYPEPGVGVDIPCLTADDFISLAKALGGPVERSEPLAWHVSGCDVGFPHDAPDFVSQIKPELLDAMIAVPMHERWRIAESWAQDRFGSRPSKERQASHKRLFNTLCEHAALAVEYGRLAILVEPQV